MQVSDAYNTSPVSAEFNLTILPNSAPQVLQYIPDYEIVNYNLLTVYFEPIDVLFQDPEGGPMTADVIQGNGEPIPSFLRYDSITNVLSGIPTFYQIGDWPLSLIAIDNSLNSANITFTVRVFPCYYK